MIDEFSVCQFFENGSYEYIARYVSAEKAIEKAQFYTNNVTASLGITKRVIITDFFDFINWEWEFGKGVIFPKKEANHE